VLAQIARRLAEEPDMTEKKVMEACQNPMNMAKYFR
jgi:hypothetical protein